MGATIDLRDGCDEAGHAGNNLWGRRSPGGLSRRECFHRRRSCRSPRRGICPESHSGFCFRSMARVLPKAIRSAGKEVEHP